MLSKYSNYEIVSTSSKRIEPYKYYNEIIIINTSSYEKFKIEFYTNECGFEICKVLDLPTFEFPNEEEFGGRKTLVFDNGRAMTIKQERTIIKVDDRYYTITKLD